MDRWGDVEISGRGVTVDRCLSSIVAEEDAAAKDHVGGTTPFHPRVSYNFLERYALEM